MAAILYFPGNALRELPWERRRPPRTTWTVATIVAFWASLGGVHETRAAKTSLALQRPVTATWSGQSFGRALSQLAAEYDVPIWLDRRVDPNRRVELQLRDLPLLEAFRQLAHDGGATAQPFRGLVYIGPSETSDALEARASAMRSALGGTSPSARRAWLRSAPWSCPRLSEPRQLLVELAAAAETEWENPTAIPHDVWDERSLPAMTRIDQATLLLAGFDLECEPTKSGQLRIVASLNGTSSLPGPPPESTSSNKPARRQAAEKTVGKRRATTRGKTASPQDLQRITLQVKNQPLGAILDRLTQQLHLNFTPNAQLESTGYRQRLASCQVEKAGIDETLAALLSPLDIDYRRTALDVELLPKKAEAHSSNGSAP